MILKRGGFGRPDIFMRQQVGLISRLMPDPGLSTGLCVGVVPQRGGVCGSGSVPCRPSVLRSGTADRTGCCCPGSSSFPAQMRPEGTTLVLAGSLPLADWNPLEVAGPVRRQGRAGQGGAQAGLYPVRCSRLGCPACLPDGSFRFAAICVPTLSRFRSKRPL